MMQKSLLETELHIPCNTTIKEKSVMNKEEIMELRKLVKPNTTVIAFVVNAYAKHTDNGVQISSIDR